MLVLVLVPLGFPGRTVHAQDEVAVDTMGKFLGHTVMCECIAQEDDHLLALYYALMVEWDGRSYADSASGYMKLVLDGDYRNEDAFCAIICNHEFTTYLTDVVTIVDLKSEPETFLTDYSRYREMNDGDRRDASATSEALPECNATDDLIPGVGCEGRRRSRINGY